MASKKRWLWALVTVGVVLILSLLGENWHNALQMKIRRTYLFFPYYWAQVALLFLFGVILNTNLITDAVRNRKLPPVSKEYIQLACFTAAGIIFFVVFGFAGHVDSLARHINWLNMLFIYLGFTSAGIFFAGKE